MMINQKFWIKRRIAPMGKCNDCNYIDANVLLYFKLNVIAWHWTKTRLERLLNEKKKDVLLAIFICSTNL